MAKRARPTYDYRWYTPSELKTKLELGGEHEKEVRKEYTKLRDIAQKRLKRLEAAGMTDRAIYEKNVNHYPKLASIKTKSELAQRLSDLSRFVASSQSTVSGIKTREKKVVSTLHEHGFDFVNIENLRAFGDFMDLYRDEKMDTMGYDSGDAAELYSVVEKHKLDPDEIAKDFEFYLENVEAAKELRKHKSSTGDTKKFKKRLERAIKKKEKLNISGSMTYHNDNSVSAT